MKNGSKSLHKQCKKILFQKVNESRGEENRAVCHSKSQVRCQKFALGGLFWRLETTTNDLDLDFDWSSFRLSRFFESKFR